MYLFLFHVFFQTWTDLSCHKNGFVLWVNFGHDPAVVTIVSQGVEHKTDFPQGRYSGSKQQNLLWETNNIYLILT